MGVSTEPLPPAIPFSEVLADTHALQSALDLHIALMHCNVVHADVQGPALNESQALKIANRITTLMKDCDATLAVALLDGSRLGLASPLFKRPANLRIRLATCSVIKQSVPAHSSIKCLLLCLA